MSENIWYNPNDLLSRNMLMNFVVGMRGGGKTYNILKFCIRRHLKDGSQFAYVRRYENELKLCKKTFFEAIIKEGEFKGVQFEVKGNTGLINGKVACVFIAMSASGKFKSVPLPDVMYTIYDEFIPQNYNSKYLPDEPIKYMELNETINRLRLDPRTEVRTFFIANAMTVCNPYFEFFQINMDKDKIPRFTRSNNKDIFACAEYYTNQTFADVKKSTRWGKMMVATGYSNYAIDNKFLYDNNLLIKKVKKKNLEFSIHDGNKELCFWRYTDENNEPFLHCTDYGKQNIKYLTFHIDENEKDIGMSNLFKLKESGYANKLKNYNSVGHLTFDNQSCKKRFIELLRKL